MLAGGGVYAAAYPWFKANVLPIGDLGKLTLPTAFGVGHWAVIAVLACLFAAAFVLFEKRGL
jgi:hypothetical protein